MIIISATLVTTYSSFPVDVIVYFHMKSNKFRFSCLPVSRIECMLTLPSLDLVFSSKRADADIMDDKEPELNTNIPDFDKTDKKTDEKKDMFECEVCQFSRSSRTAVSDHVMSCHYDVYLYRCGECHKLAR